MMVSVLVVEPVYTPVFVTSCQGAEALVRKCQPYAGIEPAAVTEKVVLPPQSTLVLAGCVEKVAGIHVWIFTV